MLDKMTQRLDFHGNALVVRAERQRVIASNIANADTPGYVARDVNFAAAMQEATQGGARRTSSFSTNARHIPLPTVSFNSDRDSTLAYAVQTQPSLDKNTVDLDRERATFVDNSVRYEATLRFINGQAKGMLSAIQGQ
ncbi:MAG: flagellar basal body rod protein FlgB [Simplicispira sp.]|jgi:flagellar basal-body rod protein FlgB|nr:flagellar basal body rod protein FlgB [Simplicispira sp.]